MELFSQVLSKLAENAEVQVTFPGLDVNALMESACYRALERIREILMDDTLDDPACFERIERVAEVFEALGSDGGTRHDF